MYYFKVPVFTKLNRVQNLIVLSMQLIILIISITISLYRGCNYESTNFKNGCSKHNVFPGDNMITNETFSNWQIFTPIKYSSEVITDIYNIKYDKILSTTLNGYIFLKGSIVLNKEKENEDYDGIFKGFSKTQYYYDFIIHFKKEITMNNEAYNIDIKEGFLELMFLNNCSNSKALSEIKNVCFINNDILDNINYFLKVYFSEEFISPYVCNNCYLNGIKSLNEIINVLSKCISIFVMFNSLLIIFYIFIISKIKKHEIGYIKNFIDEDYIINYENIKNNNNISNIDEYIKTEKKSELYNYD